MFCLLPLAGNKGRVTRRSKLLPLLRDNDRTVEIPFATYVMSFSLHETFWMRERENGG